MSSAESASAPTEAPGPALTASPVIQPQREKPTAPAPVQEGDPASPPVQPVGSDTLPSFSGDSRYLAFDTDHTGLATSVVEVETGKVVRQIRSLNRSLAWANGGLYRLLAGRPNVIRVYDGIADRDVAHITEKSKISRSALSADGRYVATASADSHVAVWRIADGNSSSLWRLSAKANDLMFSADGRKLAVTIDDKNAAIFDSDTRTIVERISSDTKIHGVGFSPAAQYAMVIEKPGRMRVWDLQMHRQILTVDGRTNEYAAKDITDVTQRSPIIHVAFASDDRSFTTARSDGVVSLWKRGATAGFGTFGVNIVDHAEGMRVSAGRDLKQFVISPDGHYVVTIAGGNWMNPKGTMELAGFKIRLWDMSDGREIGRITTERSTGVVAVSPDGRYVATLNAVPSIGDGEKATTLLEVHIWRVTSNLERDRTILPGPSEDAMKAIGPNGILSLDGRRAAAVTDDGLVLWNAAQGIRKINFPELDADDSSHKRSAARRSLNFSANGQTLMLADGRSALAIRASDGQLIGRKNFDADPASGPVVDSEGRYAALTVPRQGQAALVTTVWEIVNGAVLASIEAPTAVVVGLARDGRIAALASTVMDPNGLEALRKGSQFSVAMKSSVTLWDVRQQRALAGPMLLDEMLGSAAFSDDGNALMLHGAAMVMAVPGPIPVSPGSFSIWNVRTGQQIAKPRLTILASGRDAMSFGGQPGPVSLSAAYGFGGDGRSVMVTEQTQTPPMACDTL